jgi:uncharacterized protein (DUF2336 family)
MTSGNTEIAGQSEAERRHLADTVGRFLSFEPDDHRRQPVEQLARILSRDLCVDVRETLAREIRACRFMPEDLAETIARDVEDISIPFLAECPGVSERLLEQIARDAGEEARIAIAGRETLAEPVGFAIAEVGGAVSVERLVENQGAELSDRICLGVAERFEDRSDLMDKIANRPDLTLQIVDILIQRITEAAGSNLIKRYGLAEDYATYVAGQSRRRALHKIFAGASNGEVEAYLRRLHGVGELTTDIIMQFLSDGQQSFFEISMAVKANVPRSNIAVLLREGGETGLERMLEKTGIPRELHPLMRTTYAEYVKRQERETASAKGSLH